MLTLHQGDLLYFSAEGRSPRPTTSLPGVISLASRYGGASVLGCRQNAGLIARLHDAGVPLRLGTPAICARREELGYPVQAIYRAAQLRRPGSTGGWHQAAPGEIEAYRAACCIDLGRMDLAAQAARRHPVWRSLEFVDGLTDVVAASLLADILDPRWHVNARRPDRLGRLRVWMGLTPRVARSGRPLAAAERQAHVTQAWGWPRLEAGHPRQFLYRRYVAASRRDEWVGKLRAGAGLLSFMAWAWLDALGSRGLFDPASILRPDEAAAFSRWMSC